ncbi:MAG: hypothetical protein U0441_17915 [Polyangiaceae bacterium]
MSAERIRQMEARRLVLVRGGKDGGDGGDLDDFYRRIGWQTGAPEPDADFERRIAEGLFAKAALPGNVVDIDQARDAREAAGHDVERALGEMLSRVLSEPAPDSATRRKETAADGQALSWDDEPSAVRRRLFEGALSTAAPASEYDKSAEQAALDEDREIAADARGVSGIHVVSAVNPHVEVRPSGGRRTGRILGAAAVALALAASVVGVVAKTRGLSAGATTDSALSAARVIAPDPSANRDDERACPDSEEDCRDSDPSRMAPVVDAPKDALTARPQKGPRSRPPVVHGKRPVPPGSVVARRSQESRRRDESDSLTLDRLASRDGLDGDVATSVLPGGPAQDIGARPGFASLRSPLAGWSDRRTAWSPAGDGVEPSSTWRTAPTPRLSLPGVDSAVSASVDAAKATWTDVSSPVASTSDEKSKDERRPSNAAWSLAGAKDRWVGASISPSPESLSAANVGAVLQLDVGKALDRL